MAWDDPPEPCDYCILECGFDGTNKEFFEAFDDIECEDKMECLEKSDVSGEQLIGTERRRQIKEEGFTAKHDDQWENGELVQAAMCYCMKPPDPQCIADGSEEPFVPDEWPFDPSWWKPSWNRIRELEKAGALIAAEIDRLKRIEEKKYD